MLNLAIECSGIAGSVSLSQGYRQLASQDLPSSSTSVRSLAPAIDATIKMAFPESSSLGSALPHGKPRPPQTNHHEIDLISVTHGPGSFTGLRVGLATVKMLSLVWKTPIAAVDTLEAIALRTAKAISSSDSAIHNHEPVIVIPAINAFRQQLFVGAWLIEPRPRKAASLPESVPQNLESASNLQSFRRLCPSSVIDASSWNTDPQAALLPLISDPSTRELDWIFTGPGLETYAPPTTTKIAPQTLWSPQAGDVGVLGLQQAELKQLHSANSLNANYIRRSAAEEKAAQK